MRTTTDADKKHIKVTNQNPGFYRILHFRRVQKLADEENVGTTKKDTKLVLHMTFPIDTGAQMLVLNSNRLRHVQRKLATA